MRSRSRPYTVGQNLIFKHQIRVDCQTYNYRKWNLNWIITIEEIAGSVRTQNREVAVMPEGPWEVLN